MKKIQTIKYLVLLVLPALLIATGCKKSFLERPPTDAIVDASFYKTDEQVLADPDAITCHDMVQLE